MTTADILAASALFGPAALTAPILARRIVTEHRRATTTAAVVAEVQRDRNTGPDDSEPGDGLAEVITLPVRAA